MVALRPLQRQMGSVKEMKQAEFVKWMGPLLDCLREVGARPGLAK